MWHEYPYTDAHELNLDWFLARFKEYYEHITEQNQKITTMEETVEQFTNFVTNYFNNLDVQTEINNKLDAMAASGELQEMLQPYFDNFVESVDDQITTQNQRLDTLTARMDEFSTLTDGSTTGDAELADIRVGFDGTIYPNAGDAVRGQVENNYKYQNMFDPATTVDGYALFYSNGNPGVVAAAFYSDYIEVAPSALVYITKNLNSSVYANVVYDADKNVIAKYYSNDANKIINLTASAKYIRISGLLTDKASLSVFVSSRNIIDSIYGRLEIVESTSTQNSHDLVNSESTDNLFSTYVSGKARTARAINNMAAAYYSDNIAVEELTFYKVAKGFATSSFGHVFFDGDLQPLSFYLGAGDYTDDGSKVIFAPKGAKWLSITGLLADVSSQSVTSLNYQITDKMADMHDQITANDVYGKHVIKYPGSRFEGFTHVAFPAATVYNGNTVFVARESTDHYTPADPSAWGGAVIFTLTPSGKLTVAAHFTADDITGLNGEVRDFHIVPSTDGRYIIMCGWTTYKSGEDDVHDSFVISLDSDFTLVSSKIYTATDRLFTGNPIFTPTGKILLTAYSVSGGIYLMRSSAAFDAEDISSLSLTDTLLQSTSTEGCLGYFNDMLVLLTRAPGNSYLMKTSNKEGTDGWSTPVTLGIEFDSPIFLPYYKGNYLFFAGSRLVSITNRYPVIGYLDIENMSIKAYGNVDPDIINYSGYPGVVSYGGEEYEVIYYQETGSGLSGTGLYYKKVNARHIIPQMIYFNN